MLLVFLPRYVVVNYKPVQADAVIVLGGDSDGSRLRRGIELVDKGWAPRLIMVSGSKRDWAGRIEKYLPDIQVEAREPIYLEGSVDTRTDAQLSLAYCRKNNLQKVLIVTSPYHSRRSLFVFNDIFAGSGIKTRLLSSGDYGKLVSPDGPWWRHQHTLETVWLEFGKILYWELTPFMEWPKEAVDLPFSRAEPQAQRKPRDGGLQRGLR